MFKAFILWNDGTAFEVLVGNRETAERMAEMLEEQLPEREAFEGKTAIATGFKPVR